MEHRTGPIVIAVCGSPAAGKTTIAAAVSKAVRVPLLTRDELAVGLGLGWKETSRDEVRAAAEKALVSIANAFAASGVTFVMESSVLDESHLRPVLNRGGSVLAVHVVAPPSVIGGRLRERMAAGDTGMQRLLEQHDSGIMVAEIFAPSPLASALVTVDTSSGITTSEHVAAVIDALDRLIG